MKREVEMPTTKARKKRPLGGWLMVEVAVGGVMASVILGSLLINVGDAMDKTTVIGREMTATMLAQQAIEQARAVDRSSLVAGTTTVGVPSGLTGTYSRQRTVTTGSVTANGVTVNYADVSVLVTFPLNDGTTKSYTLSTRVY